MSSTDAIHHPGGATHADSGQQLQVVEFWSDLGCPWASLAVHRFRQARSTLGLDGRIVLRHRSFPLELINGRGTPKSTLDAERQVLLGMQSDLGWRPWTNDEWLYPGSLLLPLEAVAAAQSADVGGLQASEDLDAALRHAFYAGSRPIGLHTETLAVAQQCPTVNVEALARRLETGSARGQIFADLAGWQAAGVQGSPHLVFPRGEHAHNPGVAIQWHQDSSDEWHVEVVSDDPEVYQGLIARACAIPSGH